MIDTRRPISSACSGPIGEGGSVSIAAQCSGGCGMLPHRAQRSPQTGIARTQSRLSRRRHPGVTLQPFASIFDALGAASAFGKPGGIRNG
jgi:hypothetical protein